GAGEACDQGGARVGVGLTNTMEVDLASASRGSYLAPRGIAKECAICRLSFVAEPQSVLTRDPYKRIWEAAEELARPEIDHVVAIAGLGEHQLTNLQILCRACNLAKGKGLIVDPEVEMRYATKAPDAVPRMHLFRMLQWLIKRNDGKCCDCGSGEGDGS